MPPPQTSGADWPAIKYGQSDPKELPIEKFVESIKQMVGRSIPTDEAVAVHKKWFQRNVHQPEYDSRQLAHRLYVASCPNPVSPEDWLRGRGKSKRESGTIDLRRFDRSELLFDVQCGKEFERLGWEHNAFLPVVWNEKVFTSKRWFEYFLSTRPEHSAQVFTVTIPRIGPEGYAEKIKWFKKWLVPQLRAYAADFGGQLIFWRLDWGRLKPGLLTNFHLHVVVLFSAGGVKAISKSWELRAMLERMLDKIGNVYYSARFTGDARRMANYLLLAHSARDYKQLSSAELLNFFHAIEGVRKFQMCGSLYAFVKQKKAEGISGVRRVPTEGGWEFQGRKARPAADGPPDGDGDKTDYFDYHLRPFICALSSEDYSLCISIHRRPGIFGRIDLEAIKKHPWIAKLIEISNQSLEHNLGATPPP